MSEFTDEELVRISQGPEFGDLTMSLAEEFLDLRENPRDGFHTMVELYEQRMLYHALAVRFLEDVLPGSVSKSWKHHDGQPCFGATEPGKRWFIVTMHLPEIGQGGGQITQHYPEKDWDLFSVVETPIAPHWDGHDAETGNRRLMNFLLDL